MKRGVADTQRMEGQSLEEADVTCAFCGLLRSPSPTRVYEDGSVFAEIDPRQPHRGHVLVMPVLHLENLFELDDSVGAAVMAATIRVARAVREAFEPDGLSLWQSNGPGAHQEVPHFHVHVMPRWIGDGLLRIYPDRVDTTEPSVRAAMATAIRGHLR